MALNDKPEMGGFQVIVWQKKDQISGISSLKLTLCRDGNTANLVLLQNACHGQQLSGCIIIANTNQMNFYANKHHYEVKVAGA